MQTKQRQHSALCCSPSVRVFAGARVRRRCQHARQGAKVAAAQRRWIMPIDAEAWSQRVEKSRVRTVHDAAALRTYLLSSAAGAVAGGLLALTILRWHGLLRKSKTIAGAKDARYSRTFIVTTSVCCGLLLAGNYARLVIHPPHAEQKGTLVQGRTNTVALGVREQSQPIDT